MHVPCLQWSEPIREGGRVFRERLWPGAAAPQDGDLLPVILQHDGRRLGLARLRSDAAGLTAVMPLALDSPFAAPILAGGVPEVSLSFAVPPVEDRWVRESDGQWRRDLLAIQITHIAPVSYACYRGTTCHLWTPAELAARRLEQLQDREWRLRWFGRAA